jgi:hypothetical protein
MAGHSFGAITAISHGIETNLKKRVKAIIGLDTWLFPIHDRIKKEKNCCLDATSAPTLLINTSHFPTEMDADCGN